jgi:hypothetical protein
MRPLRQVWRLVAAGGLVVSMVVVPLARVCAAPADASFGPNVPQWPTVATTLPKEAIAKLDLSFYLVASSWREGEAAPAVPAGYKVMPGDGWRYLVSVKPDFATVDVVSLEWQPRTQQLSADGSVRSQPFLWFTMRNKDRFAVVTGQNIGKQLLLFTGNDLIMAPVIKSRIPGSGIIEFGLLQRKCQVLLPYLKGMPCSEGLAIDGLPKRIAGTARLKITTHFADGTNAGGNCEFAPAGASWMAPGYPVLAPTMTEDGNEWTIFNITPGTWHYELSGNFVPVEADVQIGAGENRSLELVVKRGGTVKGRVVRAEDGQPVAGAAVSCWPRWDPNDTDAEGRYTLWAVAPDAQVVVQTDGFAPVITAAGKVREGEEAKAGDIKLERGGWISGRVDARGTLPQGFEWQGYVQPRRPDTDSTLMDLRFFAAGIEPDLTFRVGPLAAGSYTLTALLGNDVQAPALKGRRWTGESERIQVVTGQETKGVVISVTEVKHP